MNYFVTGATGFIGRNLVLKLLQRRGKVYILMRRGSKEKLQALKDSAGTAADRIIPVYGDLTKSNLGVGKKKREELEGNIRHFFHVAAIYDMKAGGEEQRAANVDGTRNAIDLAEAVKARCFHHVSSIAAAGLYSGVFREDMFEEAENLDHPYLRTKHESEGIVREKCTIPWRIYRPSMVLGHSQTGEIDKIDGPYYFFKLIQKMRDALPPWMPTIGIEGGRLNMVPVDFVVDAMDHIAHKRGLDGQCFHLTDPHPMRVGEVLNTFARAAHAPEMTMRIDARMFSFVPSSVKQGMAMFPPVRRITNMILEDLGIPRGVLSFVNYPTKFDSRNTETALKGTGIRVPKLEDYAWRLWDYWERHLDPDLFIDRSLKSQVEDRVIVVTGGSSGIGRATANMVAEAGAKTVIVARKVEELEETKAEIEEKGGECHYYVANLTDMEACDQLIDKIMEDHGQIDVLVNNAGRSIRRSIALSFDRFHDFERTMQLNYFGALRLIMRALPHMMKRKAGQVINISSIGVLSNAPRFSAYVASKAALDSFSRCAASEFADMGISFTTINMPLVRTPMIAPTKIYRNVPTISPEEAAEMVQEAIIKKPQRIATRLGIFSAVLHALVPKSTQVVMNTAFRLFGDSAAAKGERGSKDERPSTEQIAFASLMRGIHW
ncbi:MAG: SDR family oxidoreductase [Xanthomonadales bacterium]|nr:SDR family oxidoreductase [Xanthomonadales bacterium]